MYFALRMYFDNGGGSCYIVSVERYFSGAILKEINAEKIKEGIEALAMEDEPTLIVLADGIQLGGSTYSLLCQDLLSQCNGLKDRFGIFDLPEVDPDGFQFRNDIGSNYLSYGATFTPFLQTSMAYKYEDQHVEIKKAVKKKTSISQGVDFSYFGFESGPQVEVIQATEGNEGIVFDVSGTKLTINGITTETTSNDLVAAWDAWQGEKGGFRIVMVQAGLAVSAETHELNASPNSLKLGEIKEVNTRFYNDFKMALSKQRVILPPSAAIAGIFASVDRDRGVWKAPANVSLASVIAPVRKITNEQQERLNVDPTSGKSINAIRSFAGRGTMVWGARTLAGNDNEWRYISVRRLFIFMEESLGKATSFAVFEPNNTTTWLKVKAMAESFLYNLWQRGALAGATPDAAYYVHVGLGKTMTPQDILEGRLIVEVGVAAVRPAEFIVLRFMHKLQEA